MTTRLILDVDTGTDDAVALMLAALAPDIELVGATTVNGNTGVEYTTENTLRGSVSTPTVVATPTSASTGTRVPDSIPSIPAIG